MKIHNLTKSSESGRTAKETGIRMVENRGFKAERATIGRFGVIKGTPVGCKH